MIRHFQQLRQLREENGVTLLISILILSGITLISITIGFFAVQEIRSSRAIVLTEPAMGAAETAAEYGLWSMKRGTGGVPNCPNLNSATLSNHARLDLCKSYGAATFEIKPSAAYVFYLYNPDDINGDPELDGSIIDPDGFPITSIVFTHQSGSNNLNVTVVRIDGTAVPGGNFTVAPGSTTTFNVPLVSTGSEGRMKVTLLSIANATIVVNTNQGMPDFPTLDTSGCSSGGILTSCNDAVEIFKRRLQILVPQ